MPYPALRRVNAIERTNRGWGHPRYKTGDGWFADRPYDARGSGRFRALLVQSTLYPLDYRFDQTGPSEFPICPVDKLDREPDLMSFKGN